MAFLRTLLGGSRFLAWALVPALAVFALVMLQAAGGMTSTGRAVVVALVATAALLALALVAPRRFRWAGRVVAAVVFLAFLVYAADELLRSGHAFFDKGPTSPFNALWGLLGIGLPALWYAVRGRFGWREEPILLAEDDPLVREAIERARATIGEFLRLYPEHREQAAVKLAFTTDAEEVEHVWAGILELRPGEASVRLLTPPVSQRASLPERIEVAITEIEDWQIFLPDGAVRGGFSTQAMIDACRRDGLPVPREARGIRFLDPLAPAAASRGPLVRG